MINVVLISTYELGRQPFGLASPAAWLKAAGASVICQDLAVQTLEQESISAAHLVAFYVPMHTATRIAATIVERVKQVNPHAHLCFYGLYAPVNEGFLRKLGAETILGGEFEEGLVALARRLSEVQEGVQLQRQPEPTISLARQHFLVPDRSGLPELRRYAHVILSTGEQRIAGYTEATRGCKHLCRHCPIVPVYGGKFRIIQSDVVLEDIRRQVEAGAQHITFGDPDFFNGPAHALRIVKALHQEFPDLTYDVTIKIEHLVKHAQHVPALRETGCLFVTSAVESVDNRILEIFDKLHTREEFIQVVSLFREVGLALNPTFVTFTPWTTLQVYLDLLALFYDIDLVDNIAPIQYAIRLLIPAGSRLLELQTTRDIIGEFDEKALSYLWVHPDPRVDRLYADVLATVKKSQAHNESRREIFGKVWKLARTACLEAYQATEENRFQLMEFSLGSSREAIPHVSEPWFC
jgi:radical SAM superfamily enzyme YgiQ (UPF0313 family)